jgi:hypothetical protein
MTGKERNKAEAALEEDPGRAGPEVTKEGVKLLEPEAMECATVDLNNEGGNGEVEMDMGVQFQTDLEQELNRKIINTAHVGI